MTSDAKKLLRALYKQYKKRRKSGCSRSASSHFGDVYDVHRICASKLLPEDVSDFLSELNRLGFIGAFYADNGPYECWLTDEAISYMEQKPFDLIKKIFPFISGFLKFNP